MGTMFFLHGNNSPTIMSKMIGNKSQFSMILFSPSSAFEHRENYTDVPFVLGVLLLKYFV